MRGVEFPMTFHVEKVTVSKTALLDQDRRNAIREMSDKLIRNPTEAVLCAMISRILNQREDKEDANN